MDASPQGSGPRAEILQGGTEPTGLDASIRAALCQVVSPSGQTQAASGPHGWWPQAWLC